MGERVILYSDFSELQPAIDRSNSAFSYFSFVFKVFVRFALAFSLPVFFAITFAICIQSCVRCTAPTQQTDAVEQCEEGKANDLCLCNSIHCHLYLSIFSAHLIYLICLQRRDGKIVGFAV